MSTEFIPTIPAIPAPVAFTMPAAIGRHVYQTGGAMLASRGQSAYSFRCIGLGAGKLLIGRIEGNDWEDASTYEGYPTVTIAQAEALADELIRRWNQWSETPLRMVESLQQDIEGYKLREQVAKDAHDNMQAELARRQLGDSSVPINTEAAFTAWVAEAARYHAENVRLREALQKFQMEDPEIMREMIALRTDRDALRQALGGESAKETLAQAEATITSLREDLAQWKTTAEKDRAENVDLINQVAALIAAGDANASGRARVRLGAADGELLDAVSIRIQAELAELRADKARLDWMDSDASTDWWENDAAPGQPGNLRTTIDAAKGAAS